MGSSFGLDKGLLRNISRTWEAQKKSLTGIKQWETEHYNQREERGREREKNPLSNCGSFCCVHLDLVIETETEWTSETQTSDRGKLWVMGDSNKWSGPEKGNAENNA